MPGQMSSTTRKRQLWKWPPMHNVPLCWRGNWEEVSQKASPFSYLLKISLPERTIHTTVCLLVLQWFCAPTVMQRSISMMKTPTERRAALMKSIHSYIHSSTNHHMYIVQISVRETLLTKFGRIWKPVAVVWFSQFSSLFQFIAKVLQYLSVQYTFRMDTVNICSSTCCSSLNCIYSVQLSLWF